MRHHVNLDNNYSIVFAVKRWWYRHLYNDMSYALWCTAVLTCLWALSIGCECSSATKPDGLLTLYVRILFKHGCLTYTTLFLFSSWFLCFMKISSSICAVLLLIYPLKRQNILSCHRSASCMTESPLGWGYDDASGAFTLPPYSSYLITTYVRIVTHN